MSKKKLLSKVSALNSSLDELEEKLELILSKPLDDTISGLETLQQTKLLVLLPYIINDLIFSKIANILDVLTALITNTNFFSIP